MRRTIAVGAIFFVAALSAICIGGTNPEAKVAIHVMPHTGRSCTKNFPSISSCEDLVYTYGGGGDIDFFVVFYDLAEYQGFQYAVTWPSEWSSCTFTSCSDLTLGGIETPGDSVAHAYTDCDSSGVCIPGFGWIDAGQVPGYIQVVDIAPTYRIQVGDCGGELDSLILNCKAGVNGYTGDDPCDTGGRGSGGGEGDSVSAPALRIAHVIEVTDGSTEYMQPIWSPDGNKIAFTKPQFTGIYIRNADGSGPIREMTSADYSGYQPVWTSDSRGIVIRTRTGIVGQSISYIDVETGDVKVLEERAAHPKQPERTVYGDVTVDVDGQVKVLNDATVSLESKDSYYSNDRPASCDLRLERDQRDSGTWVVTEGDGTRRMEFPYRALLAGLSPTRDRVVFLQGDGNLYVSDLDGAGKVSLGRGSGDWDWSPDGKLIVYVGGEEDNGYTTTASELFVADSRTGAVAQLTNTHDVVEIFPRWSPDGMKITYSTHRAGKICVAVLERVR